MIKKVKKFTGIVLYRAAARYLPASYEKLAGSFSKRFRAFCARLILDECGSNVNIEKGADFALNIKIGNNSGIGKNSIVGAYTQIGDNVMMGEACFIYARNHKTDRLDVPMCIQGFEEYRPVVISDDVWIGARVTILPGAKIGKGVIIGAGAVITGEIPDYAVVGGVPARIIKYRNQQKGRCGDESETECDYSGV
mgnify:FL=1